MKVPLVGSADFVQSHIDKKMKKLEETLDALMVLPNPHVAYYLMRQAAGVCKVLFLMRTAPSDMLKDLFHRFDDKQKRVLEHLFKPSCPSNWADAEFGGPPLAQTHAI